MTCDKCAENRELRLRGKFPPMSPEDHDRDDSDCLYFEV